MLDKTLEIARGLAAVSVFLFHIHALVTQSVPWLDGFAANGSSGVVLFFVISGYCMFAAASTTQTHGRTTWSFLKRRLRRIYPPFWASVATVMLLPFALEAVSAIKSGIYVPPSPAWFAFSASDWTLLLTLLLVFFAPEGDLQAAFNPINSVYWTLAIEIQFYLVVALCLKLDRHWKLALVGVTVLSLTSLASQTSGSGLFLPYWPAFGAGLALRWMHESGAHARAVLGQHATLIGSAGFCLVLIAFAHIDIDAQLAFLLLSATALWFSGVFEPLISRVIADRSFRSYLLRAVLRAALSTGACSYSLYLLHGKLYQFPWMLSRQIFDATSPANLALVVGLTICLCYAFYMVFERPFMSQRYRHRLSE